ncbi:hypothetical protein Aduo_016403 [Ancylostoma duodenale]
MGRRRGEPDLAGSVLWHVFTLWENTLAAAWKKDSLSARVDDSAVEETNRKPQSFEFYEDLAQRRSVRLPGRAEREPVAQDQVRHSPREAEGEDPPCEDVNRDEGLW